MSRGRLVQWKNVRFVIFVRGDRGSIPAKGGIFSSANFIYSQQARTIIPTNLDGFFQSRNLNAKSCARSILLYERERSLNKLAHLL